METAITSSELKWIAGSDMSQAQRQMWKREVGSHFSRHGMPKRCLDGQFMFVSDLAVVQLIDYQDYESSWIQTIYVTPIARRKEYARQLIQRCSDHAIGIGHAVGLGTRVTNTPMIALAEKCGFVAGQIFNEGKSIAYWRTPGLLGVE